MTDKLDAEIGHELAKKLDGFKYRRTDSCLIRRKETGWQAIFVSAIRRRPDGTAKLSAHAHVHLRVLEEIYCRYNPLISDFRKHATLVENCDQLIGNSQLIHSFRTEEEHRVSFLAAYANALHSDVVPWLEKYSDKEAVFQGLVADDPLKRVTSDALRHYPVLLTIFAMRGDWQAFERIADEFLAYCDKPYGAVHRPLAMATINGLRSDLGGPAPTS